MPGPDLSHLGPLLELADPVVWAVTSGDDTGTAGCIATSVVSLSIIPQAPRVLVNLGKPHHTRVVVSRTGALVLNALRRSATTTAERLALASGHETDKLDGLTRERAASGGVVLPDGVLWLEGVVEAEFDIGDRVLFVVSIIDGGRLADEPPMTVGSWLLGAPAETKAQLAQRRAADAARDAEALDIWRAARAGGA